METITYRQAAEMLKVHYITIKQAVARGALTKVASKTQNALLVKEQVELFIGKSRISPRSLNIQERAKWENCKSAAENEEEPNISSIRSQIEEITAREIKKAMDTERSIIVKEYNAKMNKALSIMAEFMAINNMDVPEAMKVSYPQ